MRRSQETRTPGKSHAGGDYISFGVFPNKAEIAAMRLGWTFVKDAHESFGDECNSVLRTCKTDLEIPHTIHRPLIDTDGMVRKLIPIREHTTPTGTNRALLPCNRSSRLT